MLQSLRINFPPRRQFQLEKREDWYQQGEEKYNSGEKETLRPSRVATDLNVLTKIIDTYIVP